MKVNKVLRMGVLIIATLVVSLLLLEPINSLKAQGTPPMAIQPPNGATNVSIQNPTFSWLPIGDTTKYEFILAEDAAMTKVVKQDIVSGTAYVYAGNLKYSTNYFWKVRPIEPAPGDWSPVFVFTTEPVPAPPPPPPPPPPHGVWLDQSQHLEYSPNGKKIAFVKYDGDLEICVLNIRTGRIEQITDNDANDCQPAWSPNGRKIAFLSDRDGTLQIYEIDLRTGEVKRLTDIK